MRELSHNVLIVDDETQNIELAEIILKKEGYTLFFAGDIKSAHAIIRQNHLDVIVLDLMLGEESGFEILEYLKSGAYPNAIKIIVVSALNDDASIHKASTLGAEGYITKPYDIISLKSTLKSMLKASHIDHIDIDAYLENFFGSLVLDEATLKALSIAFLQTKALDTTALHVMLGFLSDFVKRSYRLEDFLLNHNKERDYLQDIMNRIIMKHFATSLKIDLDLLVRSKRFFLQQ